MVTMYYFMYSQQRPLPRMLVALLPHLDGALLRLHDSQPRIGEDRRRPRPARRTGAHNHSPSPGLVESSDGTLDDARANAPRIPCSHHG